MSSYSSVANYGGRESDIFQNIKQFVQAPQSQALWIYKKLPSGLKVQTPANSQIPVYVSSDLYVNGSIYNTSDRNLKDNIEAIEEAKHIELKNLEPKVFNYINNPKKKHYGFIAQEIEKIYPELVKDSELGYKTVNYIELIPLLVLKINSMQKEIDELKNKIPDETKPK
jgi:hypothetical protein